MLALLQRSSVWTVNRVEIDEMTGHNMHKIMSALDQDISNKQRPTLSIIREENEKEQRENVVKHESSLAQTLFIETQALNPWKTMGN